MSRVASSVDVVPEPCRIAGVLLRPFCLGHHLLFLRLGLPFVDNPMGVEEAKPEDVLLGIAVCGGDSYETTLDDLHTGEWTRHVADWLKRARKLKTKPKEIAAAFQAYLTTGYQLPPLWRYSGADHAGNLSSPWECLFKVRLLKVGLSESEILNGYLPARWYECYTAMELASAEDPRQDFKHWRRWFFTPSDAEAIAEAKRGTTK